MASEPSDERFVSLTLPEDLQDWLQEKATELDVDEETVVRQLLASYRTADELDDPNGLGDHVEPDIEDEVRDVISARLPDIVDAVSDQLEDNSDQLTAVEARLSDDIDRLEDDFMGKLQDVRERVVQVKKEADAKAPADHDHAELDVVTDDIDDLQGAVDDLRSQVDNQADALANVADDVDEVSEIEGRLEDVEDKLTQVAWVVSDLREAHKSAQTGKSAIDRIKHSAAAADIDRAKCDNCDNGVEIALMTEPNCPHCDAAVNEVKPASGFFGSPRLAVAKQLEAGDERNSNVPDAARGENR